MISRVAIAAVSTCLVGIPRAVQGQVVITAAGVAAQPYSTVELDGVRERVGGVWVGGAVAISNGSVTISAAGLSGTSEAIANTAALDRDGGELSGTVRGSPLPWLSIHGGYTVRVFQSAAGRQTWKIPRLGATVSGTLGHPTLRASLSAAYLPAVSVSGLDTPDLGVAAEAAVVAEPRRAPLFLKIGYRLERFDFPIGAVSRVEQFDRVALSLGVRIGRR